MSKLQGFQAEGLEITDMDVWIEQTLLRAIAVETEPDIRLSFAQSLGEFTLKQQGIDLRLEEL